MSTYGNGRLLDIRHVQVILKTAERCNIACKYCYFFFGDNQTYKEHPPIIAGDVVDSLVRFLREGIADLPRLNTVTIGFHGGEPLLQKRRDFAGACEVLVDGLSERVTLDLVVQTNGMLINEDWIEIFAKYNVRVGISLDGPADVHDRLRVDRRGRGTHAHALRGLQLCLAAYRDGQLSREPSVLCVLDPALSACDQFNYFYRELGLRVFDFLLPEGPLAAHATSYGEFLTELFECWVREGDADVSLRFFRALIAKFTGTSSFIFPVGQDPIRSAVFKVSSDGRLYPDDVLYHPDWATPMLTDTSLKAWLASDYFRDMANLEVPKDCTNCCWVTVCGGGHPWNRFSSDGTFDRRSSLCAGLQLVFAAVYRHLIRIGVPENRLLSILSITE